MQTGHLSGFLSTLSSETAACFILLITLDMFLAIRFPLTRNNMLPVKLTWVLCATTWLTGLLIASLPIMISKWAFYSHHSICIGLPLSVESYPGSGYSIGIFIGVNSVLFLLIAFGQLSIHRANWASSKEAGLRGQQARRRYQQDMAIARKLFAIAMTDFICWFPICVMGLMAHLGHYPMPDSVYAWTAAVALPINSSINPVLYNLKSVFSSIVSICHRSDVASVVRRRQDRRRTLETRF